MSTTDLEQLQKLPPEYLAEDISRPLLALSIALIPLLTIFFVLFLTSRILLHTTKKVEAWLLMPLGYLSCLASCVCGILFVKIGGSGRHIAYFLLHDPHPIEENMRLQTAQEYLTFSSVTFPKLAIVALYLNIFNRKWSRRAAWALGIFIALTGIQFLIIISTLCEPFAFKWNKTIPGGHCRSTMVTYKFGTLPNTISDGLILLLPIPTLYELQISRMRKVGVSFIFLVAGCGIITAIIKTVTFFTTDLTSDLTHLSTRVEIWVLVEFCSYFICACMPGAQYVIRHFLKRSKLFNRASWQELRSRATGTPRSRSVSTAQQNTADSRPSLNGPSKELDAFGALPVIELRNSKSTGSAKQYSARNNSAFSVEDDRSSIVAKVWQALRSRVADARRRVQ